MPSSVPDHDLRFALSALQQGLVRQEDFLAAVAAWRLDGTTSLRDRLGLSTTDTHRMETPLGDDATEAWDRSRTFPGRLDDASDGSRTLPAADTERLPKPTRSNDGPRYRILRPLARGGLGEVFIATDRELNREVALKEILPAHAGKDASRTRFVMEAEITGGLEHPGVVPVYGLGAYPDGRPYYAMRFIKGETLGAAIARFHESKGSFDSIDFRQLLGRFVAVCNVIAYAHSRGVLHRDLKPSNIMVGKFGETLVVDWGLAKAVGGAEPEAMEDRLQPASGLQVDETYFGSTIGSPGFMSPEQAAGDLGKLGPATDIYSLGATLYSLLTDQAPTKGSNAFDSIALAANGDWKPARTVNPDVPAPLDAICRKAMAFRIEDRYADAQAVAREVERHLADEPVAASRDPFIPRARRWMRKHPGPVAGLAVGVLVTLLGTLGGLYFVNAQKNLTEKARIEAVAAREKETDQRNKAETARKNEADQRAKAEDARMRESAARERAEKASTLARSAIDAISSGEVADRVVKQREITLEQKQLLEDLVNLYRQFAREEGNDEPTRAGVAAAYHRLAQLLSRIGKQGEAGKAYEEALVEFDALVARYPENRTYASSLAGIQRNYGAHLADEGKKGSAEKYIDASTERFRALVEKYPHDSFLIDSYSITLIDLAGRKQEKGDVPAARRALEKCLTLREKLVADNPGNVIYQNSLANVFNNLGGFLVNHGEARPGIELLRKAAQIQGKLVAGDPAKTQFREQLLGTVTNLGIALSMNGDPRGSLDQHIAGLELASKLAANNPGELTHRFALAMANRQVGNALATLGDPRSRRYLADAVAMLARLNEVNPLAVQYRSMLAQTSGVLGMRLENMREWKEAEAHLRTSLKLFAELCAEFPNDKDYRMDRAGTVVNLANLFRNQGKYAESIPYCTQALELLEPLYRQSSGEVKLKLYFRNASMARALAEEALSLRDAADKDWLRVLSLTDERDKPGIERLRVESRRYGLETLPVPGKGR